MFVVECCRFVSRFVELCRIVCSCVERLVIVLLQLCKVVVECCESVFKVFVEYGRVLQSIVKF